MKKDFNESLPSLEDLCQNAGDKAAMYMSFKNPGPKPYKLYAEAIDAYIDAFRNKYKSLHEYIAEKEQEAKALLATKGYNQTTDFLAPDAETETAISKLNVAIYAKEYVDRDLFTELFVFKIPAIYEGLMKQIKNLPTPPATPKSNDKPKNG